MGVVINDFDVTAGGPQETAGAEPKPAESTGPGTALPPQDARDIFQHMVERWERVRAD